PRHHPIRVYKIDRVIKRIIVRAMTTHHFSKWVYVHPSTQCRVVVTHTKIIIIQVKLILPLFTVELVLVFIPCKRVYGVEYYGTNILIKLKDFMLAIIPLMFEPERVVVVFF